jgi:hypothetical protein
MSELRMVLSPGETVTRVIATAQSSSGSETLLKACLRAQPAHPRAVQWLLEAVALWEGTAVRAALCAGKPGPTYVTRLYPDWFTDFGSSLYSLEVVEPRPRRVHRDRTRLGGDFRDLRQLSLAMEVMR